MYDDEPLAQTGGQPDQPTPMTTGKIDEQLTAIQQFYDKCNVFITGGTGFLGKSEYTSFLRSTLFRALKGALRHPCPNRIADRQAF